MRERLVGRAADDVEVGHRRGGETRAQGGQPGVGGAEQVGVEQPAGRGMHDRRLDPRGLALVRDAQQQVVARLERRDRVDRLRVALGQGLHVQRVGDRDAPEPEPVTQQVVHHLAGERRGQVRGAGQGRERDVRGHDEVGPGLDRRHERHQLARRQPCLVEPEVRQAQVRVQVCLAEPREVLDRRGGAGGPDAADHRRGERAHERRVVTERADAEVRVGRAGGEVARGGVDDVDAHRERLRADGVADPLGELDVAGRRERHVARERRRARRRARSSCPPSWSAAISSGVGCPPCGARPLRRAGELADLRRGLDVLVAEQAQAGGRRVAQPRRGRVGERRPGEREHQAAARVGEGSGARIAPTRRVRSADRSHSRQAASRVGPSSTLQSRLTK